MQNWGKRFQQYGNLSKAMAGSDPSSFRILMSHNPNHWEEQVWGTGIDLTLSGHTHGAQFGAVTIAGQTYSPAQWVYKRWAGHYTEGDQTLRQPRLRLHRLPRPRGMPPKTTVIELRRA